MSVQAGEAFQDFRLAIVWILDGQDVYLRHKFYSYKWAMHWSLAQIKINTEAGLIKRAVRLP